MLIGLAFAVPILWTVSVGAVRQARRARASDPREGCQAWVAVRGLPGRRYRCCQPVPAPGDDRCRQHRGREVPAAAETSGARLVDEPQEVGRSLALARVGVPAAAVALVGAVALAAWLVW